MYRYTQSTMRMLAAAALFAIFSLLAVPAQAQAATPMISVNPIWRPAQQLTTIDANSNGQTNSGDDIRYVTVDIFATTTVEFWAVDFTCTVNKLALEQFVPMIDPGSTEDDVVMFVVGPDWPAGQYSAPFRNTTDVDGKLSFGIALFGESTRAMGGNGVSRTLHIATLKYRVKEGLAAAITSPFTCTTAFLNRDGKPVLTPTFVAPPALSILPGYTLTGKVTYQGIVPAPTAAQAITVGCDDSDPDALNDVTTTANTSTGLFSISNLRTQGRYDCEFYGHIISGTFGPDLHLATDTDFSLTTAKLALLPVVLKNGNLDRLSGSEFAINNWDLILVTGNWLGTAAAPFTLGDASGDKKINGSDLSLVAGNYENADFLPSAHHLIYSMPRDQFAFQNSHLWLGSWNHSSPSRFVTGNTRDYWPAVAPDGSRIAFVRNIGTGGNDQFALFVAPIANGVAGTAKQITPASAAYDAFAPSWSPDAARLAFVCSYNDEWFSTTGAGSGNLCLIDPGGANFQQVEGDFGSGVVPVQMKIWPPAWVGTRYIYFTHPSDAGLVEPCEEKLCYLDLQDDSVTVPAFIDGSTDMPIVHNGLLGPTLFYRKWTGSTTYGPYIVRYAHIGSADPDPLCIWGNVFGSCQHSDALITSVGYYTISSGSDPHLFYYEQFLGPGEGVRFYLLEFTGTAAAPAWTVGAVPSYSITDAVGNPDTASGYYWALPNTAVFLP